MGVKYTVGVPFFSFFFFILGLAPRSNAATDFFAKYVKMRGLAQGCAFWGSRIHEIKIWGYYAPKTPQITPRNRDSHVKFKVELRENG